MIITYNNGKFSSYNLNSKQMSGEKIPGGLKGWDYFGTDPNQILHDTYDILSQRSTTLFHTHAPITSAIEKTTMYSIGPGLAFRSQPDWEILEISKDKAKEWSKQFQKLVHYAFKVMGFYDKQSILFQTGLIMGDSLLFFDRETPGANMPFDIIETGGDEIDFQATGKTSQKVELGIICDKYKRRKGFYTRDGSEVNFTDGNGDQQAIQFYIKQMARQLRGYPLAYKIVAAAKNNDRWWDAMLERAVLETMLFATANEDVSDNLYNQAANLASTVKNEDGTTSVSNLTKEAGVNDLAGGNVFSFSSDKGKLNITDLKTPSGNFDKMQMAYIDIVGMATGLAPEFVLGRYSTSYTAHKGALNDTLKTIMYKRHKFINIVCNKVVMELAKYFFLENIIEMPHRDFFKNPLIAQATIAGNWLGPVPGHINPAQEVAAKKTAVEESFMLRGDAASDYGNEWYNAIEEWHEQEQEFRKTSPEDKAKTIIDEDLDKQDKDDDNDDGGDEE